VAHGRVGIDTFDTARMHDTRMLAQMSRVEMTVDPALGADAPPLTQARVHVHLRDRRVVSESANGARGYPERPASDEEMAGKFLGCASRSISQASAEQALALLRDFEAIRDVRQLTALCTSEHKS
jgi:2-methylcitrate dehydratase PrpD